jgi:hypothetical protein
VTADIEKDYLIFHDKEGARYRVTSDDIKVKENSSNDENCKDLGPFTAFVSDCLPDSVSRKRTQERNALPYSAKYA